MVSAPAEMEWIGLSWAAQTDALERTKWTDGHGQRNRCVLFLPGCTYHLVQAQLLCRAVLCVSLLIDFSPNAIVIYGPDELS